MKNKKLLTLGLCVCLLSVTSIFAQHEATAPETIKKRVLMTVDASNITVQKHTVMERFEPEMVVSAEERMEKKQQRVADTELKISILDTLNISNRKKRRLLLDLKYSPYSDRLHKATLVATEFDEATNEHK